MTDPADTDALRDMRNTENLWPENAALVDAAADELDRLRAVIENAPHAWDCAQETYDGHDENQPCTCWKADAL